MDSESQDIVLETESLVNVVLEKVTTWITGFVEMLPNLAVAVLIVVIAALASRLFAKLVERAARHSSSNAQVASLLSTLTRLTVLSLGVFVALGVLQLEKTVTSLLAGIGVVGLALGFAFQDIASNFMSGVIMALREPFRVGDLVETHGTMGHVERVNLRATVVRNLSGQLVMIPNKDVLQNPITNYTSSGKRRVAIPVGVSYGDDLAKAADAARSALEDLDERDASEPVEVWWMEFGGSSINMEARFWIDLQAGTDFFAAQSAAIEAIKRRLRRRRHLDPVPDPHARLRHPRRRRPRRDARAARRRGTRRTGLTRRSTRTAARVSPRPRRGRRRGGCRASSG